MNDNVIWMAAAFMLMFEGLMPLLAPHLWRRVFEQMLQLPDNGIRVVGATSVVIGVIMYWLVA